MPPSQYRFDEPSEYGRPQQTGTGKPSAITRLTIYLGLAKDEQRAQKVILIILILAVVSAILIFMFGAKGHASPPPNIDGRMTY